MKRNVIAMKLNYAAFCRKFAANCAKNAKTVSDLFPDIAMEFDSLYEESCIDCRSTLIKIHYMIKG